MLQTTCFAPFQLVCFLSLTDARTRESYLEKPARKGGVRGGFGSVLFVLFCFACLLFLQRTDVQLFLLSSPASSSWNFWHHQKALCNPGKPSSFQLIPRSKLKGPKLPGCLVNLVIQKHFTYYPSPTQAHQTDHTLCPGRQERKFHPPLLWSSFHLSWNYLVCAPLGTAGVI